MCLAVAAIASWFLTQEVEGWSPFTAMKNILSLNSVKTSRKNPQNLKTVNYLPAGLIRTNTEIDQKDCFSDVRYDSTQEIKKGGSDPRLFKQQ